MVSNPVSGISCCIIHILLRDQLILLKNRLDSVKSIAWHPLTLPTLLIESIPPGMQNSQTELRDRLYDNERTVGTHKNYQRLDLHKERGYYSRGDEVWSRKGFNDAAAELTSVASESTSHESSCQRILQLLEWLQGIEGELSQAFPQPVQRRQSDLINEKLKFLQTTLRTVAIRATYLANRAQVQVQAVRFLQQP